MQVGLSPFLEGLNDGSKGLRNALENACRATPLEDVNELTFDDVGGARNFKALDARAPFIVESFKSVLLKVVVVVGRLFVCLLNIMVQVNHWRVESAKDPNGATQLLKKNVYEHTIRFVGNATGEIVAGISCFTGVLFPQFIHKYAVKFIHNIVTRIYSSEMPQDVAQKERFASLLIQTHMAPWQECLHRNEGGDASDAGVTGIENLQKFLAPITASARD